MPSDWYDALRDMCIDMDICVGMYGKLHESVYRHVHGHMCRFVHGQVCRYVYGNHTQVSIYVCGQVSIDMYLGICIDKCLLYGLVYRCVH